MIQLDAPQSPKPAPDKSEPLLLRPEDAARLLGISRSKVFSMLSNQELLSIRIGRCRRIPTASLEAWIAERIGAED
ncbi:MAG: helix-turn-helix domain-containing protein [Chloroflexota bacterium]|nr:helix-turn-helix domain-containing protein [Chloroflexota bacterium]